VTDAAALLLEIFTNDLLPVFAIAGAGFLLARFAGVQVQGVSRLTFHVLAPALVFDVLVSSTLDAAQSGRMTLFYVLVTLSAAIIARLAAIPLRLDRRMLAAFMLVAISSNSGNYGLPVTLLAFGRDALAFASVYFVSSAVFSYTGGVLIAASSTAPTVTGARWRRTQCAMRASVSGCIRMTPVARATRCVSALAATSTMCAWPCGSK
jgi:hypothetical protein